MGTVRYLLRTKEINKRGLYPVQLCYQVSGKRTYLKTGDFVNLDLFENEKLAIESLKESTDIISEIITAIEKFFYSNGMKFTPKDVVNRLKITLFNNGMLKPTSKVDNLPDLLKQEFGLVEIPMTMNKLVGVYFLCLNHKVVYVGQSKQILYRLNQHRIENKKEYNRVFYIECEHCNLNEIEDMYIKKYHPFYNVRHKTLIKS